MYRIFYLLTLVSTAFTSFSYAEPLAKLESGILNEDFRDEVPVSGRVITGISFNGVMTKEKNYFSIMTPSLKQNAKACVQILSRDGRYWAENVFLLNNNSKYSLLDYPSKFLKQLNEYPITDLAVLTHEGDCNNKGKALISGWHNKENNKAESIWVYLNSARTDAFISGFYGDEWGNTVLCERIEIGRRTGYDSICTLPLSTTNKKPLSTIKVQRRRYDRMLPQIKIDVSFPKQY